MSVLLTGLYAGNKTEHPALNESVWVAGQVIDGGVTSSRKILKVQYAVLNPSLAVRVTVKISSEIVVPAAGVCITVGVPQLSERVAKL